MRRALVLVAAAAAAALLINPASAAPGLKATGHGTTAAVNDDNEVVGKRQFSFSAVQQSTGDVVGQAQLKNPAYDFIAHFRVECLRQDFPNQATIGAVVTKSNDPNLPPGSSAFWTVYDNGEPGTADTISGVAFDVGENRVGPEACEDTGPDDFAQMPIQGGNIQVQPAG